MNQFISTQRQAGESNELIHCVLMMLFSIIPLLCVSWLLRQVLQGISQCLLLFTGWFVWTAIEYLWHRFIGHTRHREKKDLPYMRHMDHHQHPSRLKITASQRLLMVAMLAVLAIISIRLQNYFTLLTGLWTGSVWYNYMHVVLHRKWAMKIFPRLSRYHLYHHCKNPESCFGVSMRFWDDIFGTKPGQRAPVPDRIIDFYFRKEEQFTAG